jgi:hypothetical protein
MDTSSRLQTAVQSFTSIFSRKAQENIAPVLSNPVRYPFGEFEFQMRATPGESVELQTTRDFKHWENLDLLTPAKDLSVVSDRKAGNYPALFYRAVSGALRSNYVGFLSLELPPGYSLICNPLQSQSRAVADLFPLVPDGCTINKFSLVTFSLNKNAFQHGRWSNPTDTIGSGEAVIFRNPTDAPILARFVGEIPRAVQTQPVQTGTSLRGSLLPFTGRLESELNFPLAPGDIVSLYSNHNEKYLEYKYGEKGWEGEAPIVRLGEGFWIAKNSAAIWSQQLPSE